jgi:hypothetical protein
VFIQSFNTIEKDNDTIYDVMVRVKDREEKENITTSFMNIEHVVDVTGEI